MGGTAPYSYSWGHGSEAEDLPAGLVAKTYTLTVTDFNGCSVTQDIEIAETNEMLVSFTQSNYTGFGISCNGGSDGWIDIQVTGGTGVYTYNWDNGAVTEDLSGIGEGTYSVVVSDENGCSYELSGIQLIEPETSMTISETHSDYTGYGVSCNGATDGFIDITVEGGTGNYTYSWSNGATSEDLSDIGVGIYSVVVTDQNGCSVFIEVDITESESIEILETHSDYTGFGVSCNGAADGWIEIDVSGGDGAYSYAWVGLNGTYVSVSPDINNLTAGQYVLIVTDERGCTETISIDITEADEMTISESHSDYTGYGVSCNGATDGSIDVTVEGGTGNYSYSWSNGATTEDLSDIGVGTYSVTATDENGCSVSIEVEITETELMTISELHSDFIGYGVSCNGATDGFIDITVEGGTGNYVYLWSNGATTEDLSDIGAGTYSVTATDENGCSEVIFIELTQADLIQIDVDIVTPGPHILGDINEGFGTIDVSVWGCTDEQYVYSWTYELDSEFSSSEQDVSGLFAGTYNLLVTDSNGNMNSISVTVPFYAPGDWSVLETSFLHEIEVPSDANIAIDYDSISYGDYIAVSDENGNIGGMMMWDGSFNILNVYSSVFEEGDVFEWLIWDSSTDLYYPANAIYDESYNYTDEFAVGGLSHVTDIVTRTIYTQNIDLSFGWGLYSTFISHRNLH